MFFFNIKQTDISESKDICENCINIHIAASMIMVGQLFYALFFYRSVEWFITSEQH